MAGLCGVIGDPQHALDGVAEGLFWTGSEHRSDFVSNSLVVTAVDHDAVVEDQPVQTSNEDALVWVWGELFGYDGEDGYEPREAVEPGATDAEYLARLYDRHGFEFLPELNGEFVGLVYDRETERASLFTDRLGTRPVFYAITDDGEFVFSTNIQSLPRYPSVETSFEPGYLYEYFVLRTTLGVRTPLSGVEKLQPGAVTHVDVANPDPTYASYWRPEYEPADHSFSTFVDRFVDTFLEVLDDRFDDEREHGLLLSGGGDARIILAGLKALDKPVRTYHMNEWMNREARTAERIAVTADVDFEFLRRDKDYQRRALKRNPSINNFASTFNQAHANGFTDVLRASSDVMLTGGDSALFFRSFYIPERVVNLGLGKVEVPFMKRMATLEDYVDHLEKDTPAYAVVPPTVRDVLDREIYREGGEVVSHGVRFRSLRDLVVSGRYYPYTNIFNYFNYGGLVNVMPHWTPFQDKRLIDLHLQYPVKYRLRRNITSAATERIDPELADIQYANTGLPFGYPNVAHYFADVAKQARKKFFPRKHNHPYLSNGAWTNHTELLRSGELFPEMIERNGEVIDSLSFVDADGIETCYRDHVDGAYNTTELYTLLTFLMMPVAEQPSIGVDQDPRTVAK